MKFEHLLSKIEKASQQVNFLRKEAKAQIHQENWENKIRLELNYAANYLSGGNLSKVEIATLTDEKPDYWVGILKKHDRKEWYEAILHDKILLDLLDGNYRQEEITLSFVLHLHKNLLFEPYEKEKRALMGKWKNADNQLINYRNETIYFSASEKVAVEMQLLVEDWQNYVLEQKENKAKISPIEKIAAFHLSFLQIHPFYDGNGRMARLLLNLMLDSFGYPPLLIGEKEQFEYERTLALAQAYQKMPEHFYVFVAEQLLESLQLIIRYLSGDYIANKRQEVHFRVQKLKEKLSTETERIENRRENVDWEADFLPFLQKMFASFEENTAQFSDLFFETKRKLTFYCMDSTQDWLSKELFSLSDFSEIKPILQINDCTFSYTASKFRYTAGSPFSLSMEVLKIVFQEFGYQILCRKGEGMFVVRTYPYHKKLTEKEISEIFALVGEAILLKIEESSA